MITVLKKMETGINLSSEFKACQGIFKQKIFEKGGMPTIFKIHTAFKEKKREHNSFAGPMADSIHLIANFLNKNKYCTDLKEDFNSYILLQNLLVNRLDSILDIVGVPNDIREKELTIFKHIDAWAYFLKPHTTFITRYPTIYTFENTICAHDFKSYSLIVNTDFTVKYYNAQLNRSNCLTELTNMGYNLGQLNEKPILLILPNITDITNQLCNALNTFIDLLVSEKKYLDLYIQTL